MLFGCAVAAVAVVVELADKHSADLQLQHVELFFRRVPYLVRLCVESNSTQKSTSSSSSSSW
jgi:hypothetical protein